MLLVIFIKELTNILLICYNVYITTKQDALT